MPRFRYVEQNVSERLSASLRYFLLLAISNVIFFMLAYFVFLKMEWLHNCAYPVMICKDRSALLFQPYRGTLVERITRSRCR